MTNHFKLSKLIHFWLICFISISLLLFSIPVWGHGGKTHGGSNFSSFQAVQKAGELYDKLLKAEKLPESWETTLTEIDVETRQAEAKKEYMVRFTRSEGDPESVYFFFSISGDYTGSNFTGE